LVQRHPVFRVTGVAVSDEYLRIANDNKVSEGVSDRVTFVKGDPR